MKNKSFIQIILLVFISSFFCCKQDNGENKTTKLVPNKAKETELKKTKVSMDDIQGIWESYSLYVELESEFKDYTKNKYYKIVNGKNTIDITIHDQQKDSSEVSLGYIGFLDALESEMSLSENELIKSLNDSGKFLERFKKDLKTYSRKNIQTSLDFERYFDVEEILEDGFDYESETEKFNFKSLSTLPEFLFKLLKEKSK